MLRELRSACGRKGALCRTQKLFSSLGMLLVALLDQRRVHRVRVLKQPLWGVDLGDLALLEHDDEITVRDRVQAVCDRQHGDVFEHAPDHLLNHAVRLRVD